NRPIAPDREKCAMAKSAAETTTAPTAPTRGASRRKITPRNSHSSRGTMTGKLASTAQSAHRGSSLLSPPPAKELPLSARTDVTSPIPHPAHSVFQPGNRQRLVVTLPVSILRADKSARHVPSI